MGVLEQCPEPTLLLFSLDVRHDVVSVLLLRPLFPKEGVQVDRLQRTSVRGLFNYLLQLSLLLFFFVFNLVHEPLPGNSARLQPLFALVLLVLTVHVTDLFPNLVFVPWHPLKDVDALIHVLLELRILLQIVAPFTCFVAGVCALHPL